MQLPFDRLNRLAGPPDQPALERRDDDDIETVDAMAGSIDDGWDPPPLIVSFDHGDLNVEDGNHRIEGLRRSGRDRYWAIIAFDDEQQRRAFCEQTLDNVEGTLHEFGQLLVVNGLGAGRRAA